MDGNDNISKLDEFNNKSNIDRAIKGYTKVTKHSDSIIIHKAINQLIHF